MSVGPECVVIFVQHIGAVCKKTGGGGASLFTYCQTKFHFIWCGLSKYCRLVLVLADKLQTPVISLKGMGHEMKTPFEGHKTNLYFLYMRRW